jgi:hypothetical protein
MKKSLINKEKFYPLKLKKKMQMKNKLFRINLKKLILNKIMKINKKRR